jgi:hypothetical protein
MLAQEWLIRMIYIYDKPESDVVWLNCPFDVCLGVTKDKLPNAVFKSSVLSIGWFMLSGYGFSRIYICL